MIGEISPIEPNIELIMLSIPLLVSRIFLLRILKINMSELGSQDTPKTVSIGSLSNSKFTVFGDKFNGVLLKRHEFAKSKPGSFKRATTYVMVFTAICRSSKESK